MSLPLQVYFNFIGLLIVGFMTWRLTKQKGSSFIGALLGGFFIDVDHLVDYFLAFGTRFRLLYFIKGYEFLKSDKIYVFLHAWEYVFILLIVGYFLRKKKRAAAFTLAFAIGLCSHLVIDTIVNHQKIASYFISYRIIHHFDLSHLVTLEHYIEHLKLKKMVRF